jgi:uncharacterized delta-60 repeat protein
MRSTARFFAALFACAWLTSAHALDGDADPNFGTNGQVVITRPFITGGNPSKPTGDLVMLADGRYLWSAPIDDGRVWVGRAFRKGSADTTYGTEGNGRITLPACGTLRNVRMVEDGADGLVVWASACLVHLQADGSIDATFGGAALPPDGYFAVGLARDSAGRYVLAGEEGAQLKVYRFDANGLADTTFGGTGNVEVVVPAMFSLRDLNALVVRPDGRIIVAGARGNSHGPNLIVAQLNTDGTPDLSWNSTGLVDITAPEGYQTMIANALALDDDGSLIVSGIGSNGSTSCCILLARFDSGGQLVPSFGLRIFQLSGQPSIFPFFEQRDGVVLLPNHRIMLGTISFPFSAPFGHRTQFTLVRTFTDGSLDTSFGHDGWNSYTIADPVGVGQDGDYDQMHAIGYDRSDDSMLILGRTFFEDNSTGDDYTSLVRARFDLIFADGTDR